VNVTVVTEEASVSVTRLGTWSALNFDSVVENEVVGNEGYRELPNCDSSSERVRQVENRRDEAR
jgi:hypothetical protein